jgi:hypothetical protein
MENGPGSLGLVEFSARTGRPLRVVIQPQNTDGAFCGTLWSDPSGQHLTAACTWDARTGTVDNGRFTPGRNIPPQTPGTDGNGASGDIIAWLCLVAADSTGPAGREPVAWCGPPDAGVHGGRTLRRDAASARHTGLVQHLAALRAGQITLAQLP